MKQAVANGQLFRLVDPSHLDGFEDFFVGVIGVVVKVRRNNRGRTTVSNTHDSTLQIE
jgi:hypothetical protein